MTKEQKEQETVEDLDRLNEARANQKYGLHNNEVASFHDVRATLESLQDMVRICCLCVPQRTNCEQLDCMCTRNGTEALLIVTRSDRDQYPKPHTWMSSPSVEDFFTLSYNEAPGDFAGRLESYKLTGVEGARMYSAFAP